MKRIPYTPFTWATCEEYPYSRKLYFSIGRYWVGVGIAWRVCPCCKKALPDYNGGCMSEVTKYRLGYAEINWAKVR